MLKANYKAYQHARKKERMEEKLKRRVAGYNPIRFKIEMDKANVSATSGQDVSAGF
jgi:hypothetical protein